MTLPKDSAISRCDADPVAVIADIVLAAELAIERTKVESLVRDVVARRHQQRELARALTAAPDLLTSARPEGPMSVQRLIQALLNHDAQRVVLPRCARCDNARLLSLLDGEKRICEPCFTRAKVGRQPCANCGLSRSVIYRDHLDRPWCWSCRPSPQKQGSAEEAIRAIVEIVSGIEPDLARETVAEAVRESIPQLPQLHRTAGALRDTPDLLTGRGAHGSPRILALIDALLARGATSVVAPPCPNCGNVTKLGTVLNGLRCCRRCYEASRKKPCSGCGHVREVSSRTAEGLPLCSACSARQPFQYGECSACGQHKKITTRAKGTPLCQACSLPVVTCSLCKKAKPCYFADTEAPRCPGCTRKLAAEACSRCGRVRTVRTRSADGSAICNPCGTLRETCRDCGNIRNVATRTPDGDPLCGRCYEKTPFAFRDCTECGSHGRLFHHGLCNSCARTAMVQDLLADTDGVVPTRLAGLSAALLGGDPLATLNWIMRPSSLAMIATLADSRAPLTHEALDGLQPLLAVRHLRATLVAHGALPERDEQLANLERWLAKTLTKINNPEDRRLVRSFATWHHLRRLRRQSATAPLTYAQTTQVRREISTTISLLAWLAERDNTLGTCTQGHIDEWLDSDRAARPFGRNFILWAAKNRHCGPLKVPAHSPKPAATFIDQDDRWQLIRRLLHDDGIDLPDRVAGLLVLLFAQPLTHIVRITPNEITVSDAKVTLTLGSKPLELPPPVDELMLRLRDLPDLNPRSADDTRQWLFPGGLPGTPLGAPQLMRRLRVLGIQARPTRNTTLREFASELPSVVLSKLLGVHINTATRWSRTTSANHAEYAADLSRRKAFRKS
ncbi:hypothetical protein [Streptomyces sp. NRRL B-3648]|uniref:hypothetical protein n=1 Tax=Streptomyces sp. NRRL B-3648 TaxID=1519493 RepID=UPI0006AE6A06|nr:hypothetical protein [Streptomyces sp. NRRL B-3648]KOV92303.1 hypothetical protein ADL04_30535 [Streptomyces sp. NRRL B-3648]